MESLYDDCWILVFELLDLKDQISISRTCKRFHDIMAFLWQVDYVELDLPGDIPETSEEFTVLLESICGTVESIILENFIENDWDIIKLYTYPELKELFLNPNLPISDEDILKMTEIFPNLKILHLGNPYIKGEHIENWRSLEILDLVGSKGIVFSNFEKILEELDLRTVILDTFCDDLIWKSKPALEKFQNLEHITLTCDELLNHLDISDLSIFPNLRLLEFYYLLDYNLTWKAVESVMEQKQNDLIQVHLDLDFPLNSFFVKTYENLKFIYLHRQDISEFIEVSKFIPNMTCITISYCTGCLTDENFKQMLQFSKIEFLSVESCSCNFLELPINIDDIFKDRTTPLLINFCQNTYKDENAENDVETPAKLLIEGEHALFAMSHKPRKISYFPNFKIIQFGFQKNENT